MSQKFEKLIEKAGGEYSLSSIERANMSRVIREYMAHKPLRHPAKSDLATMAKSDLAGFSFVHRPLTVALVLVLVCSTGISYAAEIASRFETRLAAHDAVLAEVQSDDNADTTDLSHAIHDAGRTIAAIRTRAEENASVSENVTSAALPETAVLSLTPKTATSLAAEVATDTETGVATTTAKEKISRFATRRMHDAASAKIDAVRAAVDANSDLGTDARSSVEDKLTKARELIANGELQLDRGDTALAFHSFQDALVIAEKMDVLLKAAPTLAKAHSRFTRDGRGNGRAKNTAHSNVSAGNPATTTVQMSAPAAAKVEIHNDTNANVKVQNILPPTVQIFPSDESDRNDGVDSKKNGSGKIKVNISL